MKLQKPIGEDNDVGTDQPNSKRTHFQKLKKGYKEKWEEIQYFLQNRKLKQPIGPPVEDNDVGTDQPISRVIQRIQF